MLKKKKIVLIACVEENIKTRKYALNIFKVKKKKGQFVFHKNMKVRSEKFRKLLEKFCFGNIKLKTVPFSTYTYRHFKNLKLTLPMIIFTRKKQKIRF